MQSDARDQIYQALLGLVILAGAYIILFTINPELTKLSLPQLERLGLIQAGNASGTRDVIDRGGGGGGKTCESYGTCNNGPAVEQLLSCIRAKGINLGQVTTYNGSHSVNSCHFGGKYCRDGSHAVDFGNEGSAIAIFNAVSACSSQGGFTSQCHCEDANGERYSCNNPAVNHLHCNVDHVNRRSEPRSCGCN